MKQIRTKSWFFGRFCVEKPIVCIRNYIYQNIFKYFGPPKNSTGVDGGLSGGPTVHKPESEDPHHTSKICFNFSKLRKRSSLDLFRPTIPRNIYQITSLRNILVISQVKYKSFNKTSFVTLHWSKYAPIRTFDL